MLNRAKKPSSNIYKKWLIKALMIQNKSKDQKYLNWKETLKKEHAFETDNLHLELLEVNIFSYSQIKKKRFIIFI